MLGDQVFGVCAVGAFAQHERDGFLLAGLEGDGYLKSRTWIEARTEFSRQFRTRWSCRPRDRSVAPEKRSPAGGRASWRFARREKRDAVAEILVVLIPGKDRVVVGVEFCDAVRVLTGLRRTEQ